MIRAAKLDDLDSLVELESRSFDTDRLSARSFRHLLRHGNDELLVAEVDGALAGYSLTLFRRSTSLARLYSVAVDPRYRGRQIGRALVLAAQSGALERGATRMRLEVRKDNDAAQQLYRSLGYRDFGTIDDYYEDHAPALRLEKALAPHLARDHDRIPWYRQTLEFTCGPACLMMAMKAQDSTLVLDRTLEIRLWREATTVFMTSGHGGCGPLGLALAASRRGFAVELSVSDETGLFTDSVRSEEKKEVIRLVEQGFQRELAGTGIRRRRRPPGTREFGRHLAAGGIPLVLISSYRLHGDRVPHWVLVTAMDEVFVYINDPFVDTDSGRTDTDCIGIPIQPGEFERMSRLGRRKHHACVVVYPRRRREGL